MARDGHRPRGAAAVAVLLLLAPAACFRVATDPASFCAPFTGNAPLAVRGVRPGQPENEVLALLGPPDRRTGTEYQPESLQWSRLPDLVVSLERRTRRVGEVLGNQLDADGSVVLSSGMSVADVKAVLGKPSKEKGHYRPSGSGVISLGRKRTGRTLWYRRPEATAEVTLNEESLAWIRLTPP